MSDKNSIEKPSSQTILTAAAALLELGYRPIPTKPGEKRPGVNWKKFQTVRPTLSDWEKWIEEIPGCGIGIVTNGLVIVDVDLHRDKEGKRIGHNVFIDQPIIKELMEKAPVVRTRSGGVQIYFQQNPDRPIKNSASLLAKDVDIRADGGFAVVPPSVAAGGSYLWIGPIISTRPPDLPMLPDLILDRLAGASPKKTAPGTGAKSFEEMCQPIESDTPLVTGNRNQTIHKLASKARGMGLAGNELKAIIKMHNSRCVNDQGEKDPLPLSELKLIYDGVMNYPTNQKKSAARVAPDSEGGRLTIQTNGRRLQDLEADCWRAVLQGEIYSSAGSLVQLVDDGRGVKSRRFTKSSLWLKMGRLAHWVTEGAKGTNHSTPPLGIMGGMIDDPHPDVPILLAIANAPFYTSGGELIQEEGYHRQSKTFLSLDESLKGIEIPKDPAPEEIMEAFQLLSTDLLGDFPFADASDMCHTFAGLIAPFMREMIAGPVPIHMIEAPTPGSGKTLLAALLGRVITGRSPSMMTMPRSGDEQQKVITTILLNSPQITVIDNVAAGVWSSQFASALTADEYSGRILGKSESCDVPVKTIWIFSGNNPAMSEEIARRCIRIRLIPETDKPFMRSGFRHDDVMAWVRDNRKALVVAVLVLIQAWIARKKPKSQYILGSFQSWASQIGAILDGPGINGFLENQEDFIETADDQSAGWLEFVVAWQEKFGPQEVTASQLYEMAEFEDLVPFALDGKTPRSQKIKFGKLLVRQRDKVVGGQKVLVVKYQGTAPNRYKLVGTGI